MVAFVLVAAMTDMHTKAQVVTRQQMLAWQAVQFHSNNGSTNTNANKLMHCRADNKLVTVAVNKQRPYPLVDSSRLPRLPNFDTSTAAS